MREATIGEQGALAGWETAETEQRLTPTLSRFAGEGIGDGSAMGGVE